MTATTAPVFTRRRMRLRDTWTVHMPLPAPPLRSCHSLTEPAGPNLRVRISGTESVGPYQWHCISGSESVGPFKDCTSYAGPEENMRVEDRRRKQANALCSP